MIAMPRQIIQTKGHAALKSSDIDVSGSAPSSRKACSQTAARCRQPSRLKKKPSDYIRSGRVYFNCEGGEVTLPYALKRIGHKTVLFASDFPHETNIERAKREIEELMDHEELSDEMRQAIFHDNIVQFYGPRLSMSPSKGVAASHA